MKRVALCLLIALACPAAFGAGISMAGAGAGRSRGTSTERPRIVVLGDSLATSPRGAAFPELLQERLDREGYQYEVVNAGVGGDTTAGGVRRLEKALSGNVEILVVELGGNDGLRGVPVDEIERNLTRIIEEAKSRGIVVLLAAMETPPRRGMEYTILFHKLFYEIEREQNVTLIPFILTNVFGRAEYTQGDGIHPNRAGAEVIAETVWKSLEPVLKKGQAG